MNGKRSGRAQIGKQGLRIDKLLWFLRFCHSRAIAKRLAEKGHIRLNGRRIVRAHAIIRQGDIVTIPHGREIRVIRILHLPDTRGGAPMAERCYEILQTG
ncbi:RNA-binding S4 domain-containing protein [Parasphingorhabdus sp.]|uniref:RNA-binding S4 domain-containing protein n=1 Tax=Parasphingorhabdus sp. TaxID=2709688 RepID=UPI000AA45D1B